VGVRLSAVQRRGRGLSSQQRSASGGGRQRSRQGSDGALTGWPRAIVPQFKLIQTGEL
jgi:hypothetical protein